MLIKKEPFLTERLHLLIVAVLQVTKRDLENIEY